MGTLGSEISHALADHGVEVIFGVPGVHNIELYRGIEDAGITHVLARHEGGASFMADGYARASGKPGVCLTISGPGLTNALTGLGQAYSDSIPVLCLSSCLGATAGRRGQLHQMRDQRGAAAAVCDWAEEARSADDAFALLARAFTEFQTQRARPKYVQVPIGLAGAPAPKATVSAATVGPVQPAYDSVSEAVAAILDAERPLFVFGGGARSAGQDTVATLLEMTGAAAFTTYAGRGLVSEDWPLALGASLYRNSAAEVLAMADLVVFVGTELAEVDLGRDDPGHSCPAIHIDIDPAVLARARPGDSVIRADAAATLRAMTVAIPARADDQPLKWSQVQVKNWRARWQAEVSALYPGIATLCDTLRAALPRDSLIYSDMTQFAYAAKEVWDMPGPGLWHHPSGFGTLGYALPAAIGGAMARCIAGETAPVVCIAGDYGFQYTLQELATAVELNLPILILLWDNSALKEIADVMTAAQIAPSATQLTNPDFLILAKAYGCRALEPADLSALIAAVAEALSAEGPTLIRMTPQLLD